MSVVDALGIQSAENADKLTFTLLDNKKSETGDTVVVDYNPKELSIAKKVNYADIAIPGLDSAPVQFVSGSAETMSLALFFDTSKNGMGEDAQSVIDKIKPLYSLVKIDGNLHTPPIVRISWGDQNIGFLPNAESDTATANVFDAVVLGLDRKFLLFTATGIPVRATLNLTLKEYRTVEEQVNAINYRSSDHTRSYIVVAGDNLPGIAAKKYGDPGMWKVIATHNNIRHVRTLMPGTELELPPLV